MNQSVNPNCAQSLKDRLDVFSAAQRDEFDAEIMKIKNANSAKGKLRSGDTVKKVARSMKSLLETRASKTLSTIKNLPFSYSDSLEDELVLMVEKYLPPDFDDFRPQYLKLVKLTNDSDNVLAAALQLAEKDTTLIRENLKSEIRQHLVTLKHDQISRRSNKVFFVAEACGLLLTTFIAGMWAADRDGNYEPWIIIIAAVTASLELYRRYGKTDGS